MRKYIPFLFLAFISGLSCSRSNSELDKTLNKFSSIIANKNPKELQSITTESGFTSILESSDSLRNLQFIKILSDNLKDNGVGVFEINETNNRIVLSLGEPDAIVGATNGYLFLQKTDIGYKIDEFKGGF